MSLKNDIEMVKEELNSEEKFFEKAVVTEKFVKKYKKPLIGAVVAIVILVAGNIIYTMKEESRIADVNALLTKLEAGGNSALQSQLSALSPALADVWLYSQAVVKEDVDTLEKLKSSKTLLIGDLASYEVAQNKQTLADLESYAGKSDAIYADLAQVQAAILLMNEKKVEEAHEKLSLISMNSPLSQVAKALMHYGVK